ncbi:MAG: hypothetical protein M0R22_12815 [Dehalococcoidia bacterium]|jgi:hypothetical protein|nr:hypothetical protein [Dehalococcoidia bacterium]
MSDCPPDATSEPTQPKRKPGPKKKRTVYRVIKRDAKLDEDGRSIEFQELIGQLRSRARLVASQVMRHKKRIASKPLLMTLCRQCGCLIPVEARNVKRTYYCGMACRQAAKRLRARFAAARLLNTLYKQRPVFVSIVVDVIDTRDAHVFLGTRSV